MAPEIGTRGYGLLEGYLARQRYRHALTLLPGNARHGPVLDLGCGAYPAFLAHGGFDRAYGLDRQITPDLQEALRNRFGLLSWDLAEDLGLPFGEGFFAAVTLLAVVEHLPPPRLPGLLSDVLRVLQPGGAVVITTPAAWTHPLLLSLARLRLVSPVEIEDHKAVYGRKCLSELLTAAGFAAETIHFGHFQCLTNSWFVARRPT
jgi:SAM-dependent methyltransferase